MEKMYSAIFYADDDVDDLEFFKDATSEINEAVSLFEEGTQLIQHLLNPPPKALVIFLDLNMPVKSGFDILREIKSTPATENIPVIILTTSNNPDDVKMSKKLGANLYIKKPSTISALKKAIKHVLTIDWDNFIHSDTNFVYKH
jgi:CheY-like chemotaxis protein